MLILLNIINNVNLFSDESILATYSASLFNTPFTRPIGGKDPNSLVRVSNYTGSTIWAKVLYYTNNGDSYIVTETKIYNDIAWNYLKITVLSSNSPAFIAKVNIDGVVVKMFPVLYMINSDLAKTFMMEFYDIDVLPDSSYLVTSIGTYLHGEFGISLDSYKDLSIFKIDSEENFKWVTSIDFNGIEQKTCSFLKDSTIFEAV